MAAISYLAGTDRHRIHGSRLVGAYRADSLSNFSLSVWNESTPVWGNTRRIAQDWPLCRICHPERSSIPLLARHVPATKHAMVPAMGDAGICMHGAGVGSR